MKPPKNRAVAALAIGLGRLQLLGEIVQNSVDDWLPVEPLWAYVLVAARAKRISR